MSWPNIPLVELLSNIQPGFASGKDLEEGILQVRMNNVKPDGSWDWSKKRIVPATEKQLDKYSVEVGDILFNATNSPEQVGKSALYREEIADKVCFSNHFLRLRTNSKLLPEYLIHFFGYLWQKRVFQNMIDAWVNQATVRRKEFLNIEIPLPPLTEQKRIAAILDKADAIRRKRQQAIQLADDFLRAVFLDMFGDPVTNPKGWTKDSLSSFGSFKNGLNYNKGESGVQIKCLGVGDFGSLSKITNIRSLSTIDLNTYPSEEYFLQDGDLVFVRSNGNKELVGRCIIAYPRDEKLTFSGFCIRYRAKDSGIVSSYLAHLFRVGSFRRMMLQNGQGANIQNISQSTLTRLEIPIPPPDIQRKFDVIVNSVEQQKLRLNEHLVEVDSLFASLQQRAFRGTL